MKRPLSGPEKWLFVAPLLVGLVVFLYARTNSAPPRRLEKLGRYIGQNFSFSPDGKQIAIVRGSENSAIYDVATLARVKTLQTPLTAYDLLGVTWSADGTRLISGSESRTISPGSTGAVLGRGVVWDARTGHFVLAFPYDPPPNSTSRNTPHGVGIEPFAIPYLRFDRSGQSIFATGSRASIFDAKTGKLLSKPKHLLEYSRSLFDASGQFVANTGPTIGLPVVTVREVKTRRVLWKPRQKFISNLQWSRDGVFGLISNENEKGNSVRLWDSRTLREIEVPENRQVVKFDWGPNSTLAMGDFQPDDLTSSIISVWDRIRKREILRQKVDGSLLSLTFSPDGTKLASLGLIYQGPPHLVVFDLKGEKLLDVQRGKSQRVTEIQWSPDSKTLAWAYEDNLELFDFEEK